MSDPKYEELFLKYGTRKSWKLSGESSGTGERPAGSGDLILPEGDKFRALPPQVSIKEMMRRSPQIREWFPESVPTAEERWRAKRHAEFRLL